MHDGRLRLVNDMGRIGGQGDRFLRDDPLGCDGLRRSKNTRRINERSVIDRGNDNLVGRNRLGRFKKGRSDKRRRFVDCGRIRGLVGCGRLRRSKSRGNERSGFVNDWRNYGLVRYDRLRRFKNRSDEMMWLVSHGRNTDLIRCNWLRGSSNGRCDNRRFGEHVRVRDVDRVSLRGLERLGRLKYLMGHDKAGGFKNERLGRLKYFMGHNEAGSFENERLRNQCGGWSLRRFENLGKRSDARFLGHSIFIDCNGINPGWMLGGFFSSLCVMLDPGA